MISYILVPNPVLQLTDNDGNYVPYGRVRTLDWNTRQPKATYFDPGGLKPRANPFHLDSIGRAFMVYWEDDSAYYLELLDKNGQVIWKSAEPYSPSGGGGSIVTTEVAFENLFINGQMRFFPIGFYSPIKDGITEDVASGGWSFYKNGTNLNDSIEFVRFIADNYEVDATPIYYFEYISPGIGVGETLKDLRFTIRDVRSLSNEEISIGVSMRSALVGPAPIEVLAIQHFGTSSTVTPSADVIFPITTFNLTTDWDAYSFTVTLPSMAGKTIGTNDDDVLQLVFRMPLNTNSHIQMSDFYLKRGAAATQYPYQTYEETLIEIRRFKFPLPTLRTDFPTDTTVYPVEQAYNVLSLKPVDGLNVEAWLPPIPVGTTLMWVSDVVPAGYVEAKGQDQLKSGAFNRLYNVPFSGGKVFGEVYGDPESNILAAPLWAGSASTFIANVTAPIGSTPPWSAGTTGFTFVEDTLGHTEWDIEALLPLGAQWTFKNKTNGVVAAPATNTTMPITVITLGSPSTKAEWEIVATAATGITGGQYVSFYTTTGFYYVWFKKDGVGVDPLLPGATDSKVINIVTGNTAEEVGLSLSRAIPGYQSGSFTTLPAAAITPGEYISISTPSTSYSVYFKIDGAGTGPDLPGVIDVGIDILGTDSADEVATKTADGINPLLWKMPDWRGAFPRFWDDGRGLDPDAASRQDRGDGVDGDNVGTYQADILGSHTHTLTNGNDIVQATGPLSSPDGGSGNQAVNITVNAAGGNETRPKNYYFNAIIKY